MDTATIQTTAQPPRALRPGMPPVPRRMQALPIDSGMHILWKAAQNDSDVVQSRVDLENFYARAMTLLPPT